MYLFNSKCIAASTILFIASFWQVDAQAAAWPATSYSPYFQSLFAQASAPVAAIPSGLGAQGPSIPVPGPPGGAPFPPMPSPMPIGGGPGGPIGPAYGGGTPGAGLLGSGAAYAPAVGPAGFGRR
uniref:Uncharacterized protein n=1 Tax=Ditylenchus dipsaci TaxID=166011 RepID=A0A915DV75_9BILA